MQNCNVSPFAMMKDSPLVPEKYAAHPYLYNAGATPAHQRAAMTLEQLAATKDASAEQALAIAFSTQVYKADLWQDRIRRTGDDGAVGRDILSWNRRSDPDSRGALVYYLFKIALGDAGKQVEPPGDLSDEAVRAALHKAEEQLKGDFLPGAVYGTLFRVGRAGSSRNWPVGGGTLSQAAMATPRAISFDKKDGIMLGRSGQTSTQIVILTKPPQSWMVIPLGESDHPDSAHFDDQAEKLFSSARAKPTYFMRRDELEKHATSVKELSY
jgi:acyl-homoserine lactone acylase PvdQ